MWRCVRLEFFEKLSQLVGTPLQPLPAIVLEELSFRPKGCVDNPKYHLSFTIEWLYFVDFFFATRRCTS